MAQRHLRTLLPALVAGMTLLSTGCQEQLPDPASQRVEVGPAVVWAEPTLEPQAGMPRRGSCHVLPEGLSDGSADAGDSVPCDGAHTSVTFLSGVVPTNLAKAPQEWVARRCAAALPAAAGLTPATLPGAFVEWVWLQPDRSQLDRGARWFRCDIRAVAPAPSTLPRPAPTGSPQDDAGLPVFADGLPDTWTRCVRVGRGDRASYVTCDQPHQFRWTASVPVSDSTQPTAQRWEELAESACRPLVGPDAFWFTYPDPAEWAAGQRRLSCYRTA